MDRKQRAETVTRMCEEHGCAPKIAKIHFDQFVDRHWHPHPSAEFKNWWAQHPDFKNGGVDVKPAWNCQRYRDEFLGAKQYGTA